MVKVQHSYIPYDTPVIFRSTLALKRSMHLIRILGGISEIFQVWNSEKKITWTIRSYDKAQVIRMAWDARARRLMAVRQTFHSGPSIIQLAVQCSALKIA